VRKIRSALLTLLAVLIVLKLITAAIEQYLGFIIVGIVLITLVYLIINRGERAYS
jgi:hypothetical protein